MAAPANKHGEVDGETPSAEPGLLSRAVVVSVHLCLTELTFSVSGRVEKTGEAWADYSITRPWSYSG